LRSKHTTHVLYITATALAVYVIAHWHAFVSPYVINDDVRQQIFWMQKWSEPGIYPHDYLAGYASNYVSWGVIAIYRVASGLMNPVQFTKVVTGFLFILSAILIYRLALVFRDDVAALLAVAVYFLFGSFLGNMSGGLPRAFAFPLLLGYLCLIAESRLLAASLIIMLQSLFLPYIFLLCLATHLLYLAHLSVKSVLQHRARLCEKEPGRKYPAPSRMEPLGSCIHDRAALGLKPEADAAPSFGKLILSVIPLAAGVCIMLLKYVVLNSPAFGSLVGIQEIAGKVEYTAAGRYEILRPFYLELIEHWSFILPFHEWGPVFGWFSAAAMLAVGVFAMAKTTKKSVHWAGFRVFGYLMAASFTLYVLAFCLPLKLFVPSRYIESSLTILYCLAFALCLRIVIDSLNLTRFVFPALFLLLAFLGAVRLHNVELYDYSAGAPLYCFLSTTPLDATIAGHPEVMDNVVTFSRRKAFVTYKLSHAWIEPYWSVIKARSFDFFRAYYSDNAEEIRAFCKRNGIGYIVVRDEDFSEERLKKGKVYFEPFGTFISELTHSRSGFALLDDGLFPSVFRMQGIRVVKIDGGGTAGRD